MNKHEDIDEVLNEVISGKPKIITDREKRIREFNQAVATHMAMFKGIRRWIELIRITPIIFRFHENIRKGL